MANNSIGQFLAALRKANGMTQKQLAEKLNVSDKAISRWERDESAPDLSLIPVIAEIYGVTSDEILRGERKVQVDVPVTEDDDQKKYGSQRSEKTEKQIERLLKATWTKFNNYNVISIFISIHGIPVSLICGAKFGGKIGFYVGMIFLLVATVFEIIVTRNSFLAINGDDVHGEQINEYKKKIFTRVCHTLSIVFCLFTILVPLMGGYLFFVVIMFGVANFISALGRYVAHGVALKKGVYFLADERAVKRRRLRKLRLSFFSIASVVIAISFVVHLNLNLYIDDEKYTVDKVFTDVNSFKEYVETPNEEGSKNGYEESLDIWDGNDELVCEYTQRNTDVNYVEFDGTKKKPVFTVHSAKKQLQQSKKNNILNWCFVGLYMAEVFAFILLYFKRGKSLKIIE